MAHATIALAYSRFSVAFSAKSAFSRRTVLTPYLAFHAETVALLIPCLQQTSAIFAQVATALKRVVLRWLTLLPQDRDHRVLVKRRSLDLADPLVRSESRSREGDPLGSRQSLDILAAVGLAVAHAHRVEAEMTGMPLAGLVVRSVGGQQAVAIGAEDKAAPWEIRVDTSAGRQADTVGDACLDALKSVQPDQRLVMVLAPGNAPFRACDVSSGMRTGQELGHVLEGRAPGFYRVHGDGLAFEEPLDLGL